MKTISLSCPITQDKIEKEMEDYKTNAYKSYNCIEDLDAGKIDTDDEAWKLQKTDRESNSKEMLRVAIEVYELTMKYARNVEYPRLK